MENSFQKNDFFDLSGSLPFKEQQALARWYSYSLLLTALIAIIMFIFSGRAFYKVFYSFSPTTLLLPESLEEVRSRHTQKTEQYKLHEIEQNSQNYLKNHKLIRDALSCVTNSLPDGVQLSKISFDNDKITITGLGENSSLCMKFVEQLKQNNCFKDYIVHTITWQGAELYRPEIKISFQV